jgi:hypothetical protein
MTATPPTVGETDLHFGTQPDDPTGVRDCPGCSGMAVVDGMPCPACRDRQQLRNAWWNSSAGPGQLRETLSDL